MRVPNHSRIKRPVSKRLSRSIELLPIFSGHTRVLLLKTCLDSVQHTSLDQYRLLQRVPQQYRLVQLEMFASLFSVFGLGGLSGEKVRMARASSRLLRLPV